jgi:hypothetical protein
MVIPFWAGTVTCMLDIWRGALATRLSQVLALPDVPADVGQAFTEIWRLAMTQAGSLAEAALAQEQKPWPSLIKFDLISVESQSQIHRSP